MASGEAAQDAVQEVLAILDGTHEVWVPRGVAERYTGWASGRRDEGMAFIVAATQTKCGYVAYLLHDLAAMEIHAADYMAKCHKLKQWAYQSVAEFARDQPKRSRIREYRVDWTQQAARDGLCEVMWGHVRGTGLDARSAQFGVSKRQYEKVRDHAANRARGLLDKFKAKLSDLNDLDVSGYN